MNGKGVRVSNFWRLLPLFCLCLSFLGSPTAASAQGEPPSAERWESVFDGKSLGGWKRTEFGGGGEVRVEDSVLIVDQGEELSGFNWTRGFPKMNYEVELEAQRRTGLDFFCAVTFPVSERFVTFVVGGWGGSTVGISSINKQDASQNETSTIRHFKDNRWYKIRVRVEPSHIQAWIDDERVVDLDTRGKELDLRTGEIDLSVPLGISTFRTTAAFRELKLRRISPN